MRALSPYTAITGRVEDFLHDVDDNVPLEKRVFPSSCTVYKYDNNLHELMTFCSGALRRGAGVKVQLEGFKPTNRGKLPEWYFLFDDKHPDFPKLANFPAIIKEHYMPIVRDKQGVDLIMEHMGERGQKYRYIQVADSMESREGLAVSIETSWYQFIEGLQHGYTTIVDLSALRPAGTPSSNRLIATGALGSGDEFDLEAGSFVSIYYRLYEHLRQGDIITLMQLLGQINRTLRQGRDRKIGIICTALKYDHPQIEQYLKAPLHALVGSQKKGVRIDEGVLQNTKLVQLICDKVNEESVFLEKINPRPELYSNVCVEILLPHRGTCLLSHVNAGAIKEPSEIVEAMVETTKFLAELWCTWRDKVSPEAVKLFRPLAEDRQIGVGWIGWANFLRYQGVTYKEHTEALQRILDLVEKDKVSITRSALITSLKTKDITKAQWIAIYLVLGYAEAAKTAKSFGLERAFTMAPTQTAAYRYEDLDGYVCSRAIDPPFTRRVRRNSKLMGRSIWINHGSVETAKDVGSELHEVHWNQWQRVMNLTGMAHTMSYDLWHPIDPTWLTTFIKEMSLHTTYYNFADNIDQSYLNKGVAQSAVDAVAQPACDLAAMSEGLECGCAE